ncbi:receptor-type tyrosine-protein phosphatase mu-like isoform X2 [Watersipora subatra]|uniref:receptor-type tyrosine-protein phosphatase mu-like isoform X2 n=1 Tax=Watersipora subatra TaxID=2589382 RepID=UPI00355C9846
MSGTMSEESDLRLANGVLYENTTYFQLNSTSGTIIWNQSNIIFVTTIILFSVAVFAIATVQWLRVYRDTPAAKKKIKEQKAKKGKALEEKRIGEVSMDPVLYADFLSSYKRKLKDNFFSIEFKALHKRDEDYPQDIARLPCNFLKNNARNVLPYDHSRVCLEAPPALVETDYINASFIYKKQKDKKVKAYIAAQGPLSNTVTDFWRMVWQEGITTIVMLTNVFSYSKQECEKYWHNTYSMYGDIHVRHESVATTCHYTIRQFSISKVGQQKSRYVSHFQFHTWTEQEIPDCPAVLEFRRKVKAWYNSCSTPSPILVHCGDGAGRTGAYITLDIVLDNMRNKKTISILSTICDIRKFRPSLVDHLNQLKLIYQCVANILTCGSTVIKAGELTSLVQQMAKSSAKISGFEREYKVLKEITPRLTIGDCAGGHRVENRRKSRDIMIQPPERARPYLMTFDSSDSSDFINAVYVNGYRIANEFVVTQWPLKNTCKDFWRLIFDAHITSVIVLHDSCTSRNFPEFWPKKEGVKERFGPVCSTLTKSESTPSLIIKTFDIKKALVNPADISSFGAETRPVQIIFLKNWPDSQKIPLQNYAILDLLEVSTQWKDLQSANNTPTLVVSKNGVSRVGVFCAASICLNKLHNEGEVDVFNAARTVMQNRPQLIENLAEYTRLYTYMRDVICRFSPNVHDQAMIPPLEIDTYNYTPVSRAQSTDRSCHTESTRMLSNRSSSLVNDSVSSQPSVSRTSRDTSQISALPSARTSTLQSEISISSRTPSGILNGQVCSQVTSEPINKKFTDGKGFLHYAQPVELDMEDADSQRYQEDNLSTASSFKMDSDVLSLDNAEFGAQLFNSQYMTHIPTN